MKPDELMTLVTFDEWDDANRLKDRLDEAGIAADVLDERAAQWFLLFSKPHSAMRVRVNKSNFDRANELMREWDRQSGILRNAVSCPECGSYTIEYPQFSRKTYQSVFFAVLTALRFTRRLYYCQMCHFTWSPEPAEKGPELDILNWPIKEPKKKRVSRS